MEDCESGSRNGDHDTVKDDELSLIAHDKVQAEKALEEAKSAWDLYHEGKLQESIDSAERAAQFLAERYISRFFPSLVAVDANNRFLFTVSKQLL